jgi:hypothetical protein
MVTANQLASLRSGCLLPQLTACLAVGAEGSGALPLLLIAPDADVASGAPPVRWQGRCAHVLDAAAAPALLLPAASAAANLCCSDGLYHGSLLRPVRVRVAGNAGSVMQHMSRCC